MNNHPYRSNFGNNNNDGSNTNINKLNSSQQQQQYSNQLSAATFQQQQQQQPPQFTNNNNFLISTSLSSNNNSNTIPNSPHSDTAALPVPQSILGMAKRPLSVPPQAAAANNNTGNFGKIGGGGKHQQQLINRQHQQNSMMSTGEYLSLQIRRPHQIIQRQQQYHYHQQQPIIAEEIELISGNNNNNKNNVIINEDDGKEYYLNDDEGSSGNKRNHNSSFGLTSSNQSKKLKIDNQSSSYSRCPTAEPVADVVLLDEEDEVILEDSGGPEILSINSDNLIITSKNESNDQISSQLQKKNTTTTTSLTSSTTMLTNNPASAGGFTDHSSAGHSPIKSIDHRRTDINEDVQPKTQLQQEELELRGQKRRAPILLDSQGLERAMSQKYSNEGESKPPLEEFLQGQYLLSRLHPFFEFALAESKSMMSNEMQRPGETVKLNLPLKELNWSSQQGTLTFTFPSVYTPQQPQNAVHLIRMQLQLCPKEFKLITKLEYSGFNCPSLSDIRIFERFFTSQVLKIDNEMAVFSFISLCRFSLQHIYASLSQLMLIQMEPGDYPYRIEIELLHTTEEQQQQNQQQQNILNNQQQLQQKLNIGLMKKVQQSVMISANCKQFLFIIYIYTNNSNVIASAASIPDRRRILLRYYFESNELTLFPTNQQNEFDYRIAETLKLAQSELISKQTEDSSTLQQQQQCSIWPCIKALLEGKHMQ